MFELLVVVGLATLVSGLCSLSEAVLYSVPWSHLEQMRKSGKKSGLLLFDLRNNVERPIAAILTLNTVANTAGAAVAGAFAAALFGTESLIYFSAIFTVIILVFAEILPKTIGVMYSRQLAGFLAKPLCGMVLVFSPVIWLMDRVTRLIGRKKSGPDTSEDDLRAVISLTRRAGVIKAHEELSIRNILTLDTKMVKDILTPRTVIFSFPSELTVGQARKLKTAWPHSRIPVYDEDDQEDIVGLVYRRELLEALANDQDDLVLSKLMKPVQFVLETTTLDKLLVRFLESRMHMFIVLDEYGGLAGLVTLEDVLEEILGSEIVDETDQVVDMRELARQRRRLVTSKAAS
ncbi:Hemolysin, contains CBS domains [Desulfonatronum thiosulfatophilum]|uniref:Hemolysin, contains CBS domains n=1 Tax=Desulfonatronum thiosulfatophilum TaxID=617002 RepID=A0A1G5ZZU9_9BACT|nr:hemolysin family protein [Desulfonatronum thiosulfatophilum]SDB01721.1 Hemolysin, contains CBS domains [Desulfonatronum thiosulfatophilum]